MKQSQMGWLVALKDEGSNCFHPTSRTEKATMNLANASWKIIYLGIKRKKGEFRYSRVGRQNVNYVKSFDREKSQKWTNWTKGF